MDFIEAILALAAVIALHRMAGAFDEIGNELHKLRKLAEETE